ncbi:MAG: MMPL family transporter, partial [Deltaproteobacteria bacterium]|nr:MMPL family transporter [Deltaproteobacteria bacterium]
NITARENLALIRDLSREFLDQVPYADDVVSLTNFEFAQGVEGGIEIVGLVPEDLDELTDHDLNGGIRDKILGKKLFRDKIISKDGREAWIFLRLKPVPPSETLRGGVHADYLIGEKFMEISGQDKYASINPKTIGMPVLDVEKRIYFSQITSRLILMSILVIAVAMGLATRKIRAVFFPFLVTIMALLGVFGLEGYLGFKFDPVTVFLPIFLTMAMSTCYSIHILNFFDSRLLETGNRLESILFSTQKAGWSLLSSALTTMAGLISFLAIPMRPIRFVGLTAALLVGATFLLVYVLMPILLSFGRGETGTSKASGHGLADRLVDALGRRVLNRPWLTMSVFFLSFGIVMTGLKNFEVSFDVRRTYGTKVKYIQRMFEVSESSLGSLYSYGIAIELPRPDMAKDPLVLGNLRILEDEISQYRLTKRVSSLVGILEDLNQVLNDGQEEYLRLPETPEEVAQMLLLYENAGGRETERWIDYDYQRLRVMVEVDDYNSAEILRTIEGVKRRATELFPGANVIMTGSLTQFTVMMQYITWGQIKTFYLALLTIALVMFWTFRSLRTALLALIPNAVPVLAVSGLMGWLSIPLDIMTVTIIPMLLGLAVDDTIHFINHSSREFMQCGNYGQAVYLTEKSVGKAIILTSVILILAFSPYLVADIRVFFHMGFLIALGILAALMADLFVTPVLLKVTWAFGPERTGR